METDYPRSVASFQQMAETFTRRDSERSQAGLNLQRELQQKELEDREKALHRVRAELLTAAETDTDARRVLALTSSGRPRVWRFGQGRAASLSGFLDQQIRVQFQDVSTRPFILGETRIEEIHVNDVFLFCLVGFENQANTSQIYELYDRLLPIMGRLHICVLWEAQRGGDSPKHAYSVDSGPPDRYRSRLGLRLARSHVVNDLSRVYEFTCQGGAAKRIFSHPNSFNVRIGCAEVLNTVHQQFDLVNREFGHSERMRGPLPVPPISLERMSAVLSEFTEIDDDDPVIPDDSPVIRPSVYVPSVRRPTREEKGKEKEEDDEYEDAVSGEMEGDVYLYNLSRLPDAELLAIFVARGNVPDETPRPAGSDDIKFNFILRKEPQTRRHPAVVVKSLSTRSLALEEELLTVNEADATQIIVLPVALEGPDQMVTVDTKQGAMLTFFGQIDGALNTLRDVIINSRF